MKTSMKRFWLVLIAIIIGVISVVYNANTNGTPIISCIMTIPIFIICGIIDYIGS